MLRIGIDIHNIAERDMRLSLPAQNTTQRCAISPGSKDPFATW